MLSDACCCVWSQVLFDKQRLELVRRVEMGSTVAALLWHERLNQIIVGTGQPLPLPLRLRRCFAGGHTQFDCSQLTAYVRPYKR